MNDFDRVGRARDVSTLLAAGRALPGVPRSVLRRVRRKLLIHRLSASVLGLIALLFGASKASAASTVKLVCFFALTGVSGGLAYRAWSTHHSQLNAAPPSVSGGLDRSLAKLAQARQALAQQNPARALALLDDPALDSGPLAEDAAAARVISLCANRNAEQAEDAKRSFEQRWPRSTWATRLVAACAASPPSGGRSR